MEYHQSLVSAAESVAEYELEETVFLNIPNGDAGLVFAYVVYKTHLEYLIRTESQGIMQVDGSSLVETKRII